MEKLRLRKQKGEKDTWEILKYRGSGPYTGPGGETLTIQGTGGMGDEWSLEKGSKGNWYILDVDSMTLEKITEDMAQKVLASADPGWFYEEAGKRLPRALTPPSDL